MNVAQGRLDYGPPVAVVDIGSNSVRLVVYEGLTRSPTPIFNEKVLAGLGREVQSTGLLAPDAVEAAFATLRRFRALCDRLEVVRLWAIATAACRDAANGKAFVTEAERICGVKIDVLPGKREAELSALGVVSGFHRPDGIVGRMSPRSRSRRRRRSSARSSRMRVCSPLARAVPFSPSGARGAPWRGCTCGRPAIRSM
jgi:exopolyphosphatase/guanosine-5'-triphosphate,3'-diphosphate pyrophosphatase